MPNALIQRIIDAIDTGLADAASYATEHHDTPATIGDAVADTMGNRPW